MKLLRSLVALLTTMAFISPSVSANELSELKTMVEQLKSDYESKITTLEAKIQALEANQEKKVNDKMAELRDEIKEEIKNESLQVEYVGRHNAPVGEGGLVVDNPFGFGNVSLGGYVDMEYLDLDNAESTFRQHRWVINIGAQVNENIR